MALTIRRAMVQDADGLAACIDAAYANALARGVSLPPVSEGLAQDIRDHLVWVAEEDGLKGGIVLGLTGDTAHLINIAVDPSHSGRGIGKRLIDTAVATARELGATRMNLATHVDMPGNVALYTHLGWHETGRDANKVMMSRSLVRDDEGSK